MSRLAVRGDALEAVRKAGSALPEGFLLESKRGENAETNTNRRRVIKTCSFLLFVDMYLRDSAGGNEHTCLCVSLHTRTATRHLIWVRFCLCGNPVRNITRRDPGLSSCLSWVPSGNSGPRLADVRGRRLLLNLSAADSKPGRCVHLDKPVTTDVHERDLFYMPAKKILVTIL